MRLRFSTPSSSKSSFILFEDTRVLLNDAIIAAVFFSFSEFSQKRTKWWWKKLFQAKRLWKKKCTSLIHDIKSMHISRKIKEWKGKEGVYMKWGIFLCASHSPRRSIFFFCSASIAINILLHFIYKMLQKTIFSSASYSTHIYTHT